jgi:hypothetical protein
MRHQHIRKVIVLACGVVTSVVLAAQSQDRLTFSFDAASKNYTLKAGQSDPSFGNNCHACHTAGAKTTDFVFTAFARR